MAKLAIAVSNLGPSQQNFCLIHQANGLLEKRADLDILVLFENVQKPCVPMNFACMHITEGWGYDGPVVATNLSTASKLLRFPCVSRKLFYPWDVEWLRLKQKAFNQLQGIYGHPDLKLLARSKDHAELMCRAWNRPVSLVENFNLETILDVAA